MAFLCLSSCAGAPPADQPRTAPTERRARSAPSDVPAVSDAPLSSRPEQPAAPPIAPAAEDLLFLCTVQDISASPLPQSHLDWVVSCRVDAVRLGSLASHELAFRIHSPVKSGLVKGGQYEVLAKRQPEGYLVDPYQGIKRAPGAADAWIPNESRPTDASDSAAMPRDMLAQNIRTTPYTAVLRITAARVDDPHGPRSGYVNHRYRAHVLETIKGERLDDIQYEVMADRDASLSMPSYPIIVSLCGSSEAGFFVPDNGYVSDAPQALVAFARRVAAAASGPASPASVCR